jgi:hypothetical protein
MMPQKLQSAIGKQTTYWSSLGNIASLKPPTIPMTEKTRAKACMPVANDGCRPGRASRKIGTIMATCLDPKDTDNYNDATPNANGKPADPDNHTTTDIEFIELKDTQQKENPHDGYAFLCMAVPQKEDGAQWVKKRLELCGCQRSVIRVVCHFPNQGPTHDNNRLANRNQKTYE